MPLGSLGRVVVANTVRSPKHFALSAFGIVIGIATFVLFLASTEQVGAVFEKVFPVEEVEVIAPRATFLGKDASKRLDDQIVRQLAARPEAARVLPRMSLGFPAFGAGSFNGAELAVEIGGAADGIDPSYVVDDAGLGAKEHAFFADVFRDWDAPGAPRTAPAGAACTPPPPDGASTCPRPDRYYCDRADRTCHHRVPVVLSPTMLELYNSEFAKSHGTPLIDSDFAKFIIAQGGLGRMRFQIRLGVSVFGAGAGGSGKQREIEAVVVGISPKAKRIGMTVPLGYIQRWNREFVGQEASETYSSIVVTLRDHDRLAFFAQWLQDELDLRIEDSLGEKFATAVFVIRLVLVLISLLIIGISAINIAHNFFMQVTERRRELGLLRAVGATAADVQLIVLGEAGLIGLLGGLLGVLVGVGVSAGLDYYSAHHIAAFPYKPTTWFHFRWWIIAASLGCAAGFSVIGGFLPARRAARMEPATALAQQ